MEVIKINVVFYLLVLIGLGLLWLVLALLFKPIGRFFSRLWEDAKREMELEDKNK